MTRERFHTRMVDAQDERIQHALITYACAFVIALLCVLVWYGVARFALAPLILGTGWHW